VLNLFSDMAPARNGYYLWIKESFVLPNRLEIQDEWDRLLAASLDGCGVCNLAALTTE